MKHLLFTFIGFIILFSACQTQKKQDEKKETKTVSFDKIELLYYPHSVRSYGTMPTCKKLLKNGVFQIDSLQKRVLLDKEQEVTLNRILLQNSGENNPADCYMPKHAVLFYRNNRVDSFIEICFECNQSCPSYYLGDTQLDSLKPLFDKILKD